MTRQATWLRRIRDVSQRLTTSEDPVALVPEILDAAIEVTEAERGFLVLVEGRDAAGAPRTRVAEARGFDREALRSREVKVSRTVIRRVVAEERGLVSSSEGEDQDVMQRSSVQAARVRSILCVPLRLRGEVRGALYLDHRFVGEAFSQDDLPLLEVFADQAALALEWARLRAEAAAGAPGPGAPGRGAPGPGAPGRGAPGPGAPGPGAPGRDPADLDASEVHAAGLDTSHARPAPAPAGSLRRYGLLVGGSPVMLALYEELERAARSDAPVLLLGETGTGQELAARELHARGAAPRAPFLVQSCALATTELSARLFGTPDRPGLLEQAGEGTLLLDDVDQLTPEMQTRLLAVLRARTWPGLAGELPLRTRLVCASHADLRALVAAGELREDLYYRLDVLRIVLPPLRQREGDVDLLLDHWLVRLDPRPELSPTARELLRGYGWPGNVRELENELARLAALGQRRVSSRQLSPEVRAGRGLTRPSVDFSGLTLEQVEAAALRAALEACGGNKARAARQLGVPRSTLYHLLDRHGLG
ncbi:MAG: sigma 54-interacting transcriptional regulator [Planctomycetota bacterium]